MFKISLPSSKRQNWPKKKTKTAQALFSTARRYVYHIRPYRLQVGSKITWTPSRQQIHSKTDNLSRIFTRIFSSLWIGRKIKILSLGWKKTIFLWKKSVKSNWKKKSHFRLFCTSLITCQLICLISQSPILTFHLLSHVTSLIVVNNYPSSWGTKHSQCIFCDCVPPLRLINMIILSCLRRDL